MATHGFGSSGGQTGSHAEPQFVCRSFGPQTFEPEVNAISTERFYFIKWYYIFFAQRL